MTLDQTLLTGLVVATVAGVIITLLVHRTQAKWRQRDLLGDFIVTWAEQVATPAERDAVYLEGKGLRLPVEQDAYFSLALKIVPKGLRRQYGKFIRARSAYIVACHELYDQIKRDCADITGLPVGTWSNTKNWPDRVLLPNFMLSIYELVLGSKRSTFRLEDISYEIKPFTHSGQDLTRKGLCLTTTYDAYSGLELAQAGDDATLKSMQSAHRQMMEMDYGKKFTAEVEHIGHLRAEADSIACRVCEALRKLPVS